MRAIALADCYAMRWDKSSYSIRVFVLLQHPYYSYPQACSLLPLDLSRHGPYGPPCSIGIPVCERSSLQLRLRVSNGSLSLTTGDSRLI